MGADPFGQMRGQKLHAIVAQSRCGSQKAKNTPRLEMSGALLAVVMWKKCTPLWREAHFEVKMCRTHQLRLRRRKSEHLCGTKHISKLKVLKTNGPGTLLEVELLKK